jgi:RNA polymerase sigma factor (sigma-70 family)
MERKIEHDELTIAPAPMSVDSGADDDSDESLVLRARTGDRDAFATLWERHARSGMRVARQLTSSSDADDLVSEAYVRIYQLVLAGGGPVGAFRPYLYTTIRNLATRWGRSRHDVNVDDITEFEDPDVADDPATVALDRTLTVRAFRSLPERWQSVLWYTEIEGMDPHEVAPILGISPNSVAALAYRAREGLRKAWLQAHISDASATGECQWALARLGDYARGGLTPRDSERMSDHLATCAKCSIINEEVDEVGSHLAMVMLPLIFGGIAGGAILASLSAPGSATAAAAAPAVPAAFVGGSSAAATTSTAATTAAVVAAPAGISALTAAPIAASIAVAVAVTGVLGGSTASARPEVTDAAATSTSQAASTAAATSALPSVQGAAEPDRAVLDLPLARTTQPGGALGSVVGAVDPTLGAAVGGVTQGVGAAVNGVASGAGAAVDGVVGALADPINTLVPGVTIGPGPVPDHPVATAPASVALDLVGRGTPGAMVSVQADGVVYATTQVTTAGTWAVHITALPNSIPGLQIKQTLVSLLGVDLLTTPLSVLSNSLGITIDGLLN